MMRRNDHVGTGMIRFTLFVMDIGVTEEITEVFEVVQEFIGSVFIDGLDFGGNEIVDDKI